VAIGKTIAESPRITAMLKMFEPTTLPMAMSGCPLKAAFNDTINSGIDVP